MKKILCENRKARFNYKFLMEYEAGLVLQGGEVKAIKKRGSNIIDAYVAPSNNEMFIFNFSIPMYESSSFYGKYSTKRPKKLLLHRREIEKLTSYSQQKGFTIIPTSLYVNDANIIKVKIALAEGKKLYDKRQTIKEREWERKRNQILKEKRNEFNR